MSRKRNREWETANKALLIDEFGKDNYIVNLGHGILPNIPVDHAKAFVEAVKEYGK